MILNDIKSYVKLRKQVSLKDIALHFDIEVEAVKGLLDFWIQKGRIKLSSSNSSCNTGSCSSCSQQDSSEIYEWNPQIGNISIQIK